MDHICEILLADRDIGMIRAQTRRKNLRRTAVKLSCFRRSVPVVQHICEIVEAVRDERVIRSECSFPDRKSAEKQLLRFSERRRTLRFRE